MKAAKALVWPVLAAPLLTIQASQIAATVIDVTATCSLSQAIQSANFNTPIGTCPAGTEIDTIRLYADVSLSSVNNIGWGPNGLPAVIGKVIIAGQGHTVERAAGSPDFRIIFVDDGGELTLHDVVVAYGRIESETDAFGGGIYNRGILRLIDSTVRDNELVNGAGDAAGGGIASGGEAETYLYNSIVEDNSVTADSGASGGGIINVPDFQMVDSIVRNNTVSGLTSASGAGFYGNSPMIIGSVFSGNQAISPASYGGAMNIIGGRVVNSTFSANTAVGGGGAIWGRGAIDHCTFYDNWALLGGALYGFELGGSLEVSGSLFADSTGGHCAGDVVSGGGGNVADDTTCFGGTLVVDTPLIETALADNQGPTPTHALAADSAAIDLAGACGLGTDQRGAGRVPPCDSGAYEQIGCDLYELENTVLYGPLVVLRATCNTALIGPDVTVDGASGGGLSMRAGHLIVLKNGLRVEEGAGMVLVIDPSLLGP